METHLVDKFPLECIGVGVEVPELDETKLAKLGYTAVSCLRLNGGGVGMVKVTIANVMNSLLMMLCNVMLCYDC